MKTVLVIDDEERIRNIYRGMFRTLSSRILRIYEAPNAVAATNVLIRDKIDLILLDIKMPGIDGRTMFEVIHEYSPAVDVIVASVFPIDTQKQLLPDAMDYYDKSHGPLVLLDKLTRMLL